MRFEIRLWIKDKISQEIIGLKKNDDIEIEWDEWRGGRRRGKKKIEFEKDGKVYQILMKIFLEEYLMGMRNIVGKWKFFVPPSASYEIYRGYMGEPNNSPAKDSERQEIVKLINEWKVGRIAFFLFIIIAIFVLLFIMIRKRKSKK